MSVNPAREVGMPLAIASNERPLVAVAHTNAVVPLRPVQVVRTAPSKVSSGSTAVLSPWSLNPVSILNRTFGSVTTGPPFPTEQSLAVRPQLSRGVHVAIQRLPADAELDA